MTTTEPAHMHAHDHGPTDDHQHEHPSAPGDFVVTEQMLTEAVAQVAAAREGIEGIQLRLECARIAGERTLGVPAQDLIPLAKAIYNFVTGEESGS